VAQQLEVLPGRERADQHEKAGDADRLPQLALPRLVHLADDRVVADVFLDCVLEGFASVRQPFRGRGASRCARAGCARTSSSRGTSGFFVSTCTRRSRCCERAQRVLHDAILERVKRDHDQPRAGAQPARGRLENAIEPVELAVDPDAQRLERARRRIDPHVAALRDRAADDRGEPAGRVDGASRARSTSARAMRREKRSSPY
jgi:hypothetical protein